MPVLDLREATLLYGAVYQNGLIRHPTSAGGSFDFIFPSIALDETTSWTVEITYVQHFLNNSVYLYSHAGTDENGVDNSNWHNLGNGSSQSASGPIVIEIGPGIEGWDMAVADGERGIIFEPSGMSGVKSIRMWETGEDPPPFPTTVDAPVSTFATIDPATYPFSEGVTGPEDWNPPQNEGITFNWGYVVPDYTALSTPYLGRQYDDDGFNLSRSHVAMGADFDPRRSIELSIADPVTHGPPIGVIEPDGTITFNADPFADDPVNGHFDTTYPDGIKVTFGDGTIPEGVDLSKAEFVAQGFPGGNPPRLWICWVNDDDVHRGAYIFLRSYVDENDNYIYSEFSTPLPADFPIEGALTGDREFKVVFCISGGFYYGEFSYMALRFDAASVPDSPVPVVLNRTNTSITIGWDAVPGVSSYDTWLVADGVEEDFAGDVRSFTFTGLLPGKTYTLAVRSAGVQNGAWVEIEASTLSSRPHYHRPLRDDSGAVIRNCTVALRDPGTTTLISEDVFFGASGEAKRGVWWYAPDGVVDFYLNDPQVVDILITPIDPGHPPVLWPNQWVGDPENLIVGEVAFVGGPASTLFLVPETPPVTPP